MNFPTIYSARERSSIKVALFFSITQLKKSNDYGRKTGANIYVFVYIYIYTFQQCIFMCNRDKRHEKIFMYIKCVSFQVTL